jgi:hypothetical protein
MIDRFVKLSEANSPVEDTASIPFTAALSNIADHTVSAPLIITPNTTGAVAGYGAIQRVIADGSNIPDVSAFKMLTTSYAYNNQPGVVNIFIFFFDGTSYNVAITQNGEISNASAEIVVNNWVSRLTTAGYTIGSDRQTAYQNFVAALILSGIYSLITEMWFFEGGSALTNVLGFKNAYNGVISGSITHSANGSTGDGSTGRMDLGVSPSLISDSSLHISAYLENAITAGAADTVGVRGTAYTETFLSPRISYPDSFRIGGLDLPQVTEASNNGRYIMSLDSSAAYVMKNGLVISTAAGASPAINTANLSAFASLDGGSPDSFSNQTLGFVSVGIALTQPQATTLDTALSTLFTALGR